MFVDSHCHLDFPDLAADIDGVLGRMHAARVTHALCVSVNRQDFARVHALALAHECLFASAGVHPDQGPEDDTSTEALIALGRLPKIVAIGETGLDYYRLNGRSVAEMAWQRERFAVHIAAAHATGLPLVVHTRSASADTVEMLRSEGRGAVGGVFHCFTETAEVARAALDLGFYISFSGILTFRNAEELRDVARWVPLDRCLIETDSPYLAPVPYRGKTNQPAYVPHVAAQLAALKGLDVATVAAATSANCERLFTRLGPAPRG